MHTYKRRKALRIVAYSSFALGLGACDKMTAEQKEHVVEAVIPPLAYVAVEVGKKLYKFPHPAAKIIAIVLMIAGEASELLIDYIRTDLEKDKAKIKLTIEEIQGIQAAGKVILVKHGGTKENATYSEKYA